MSDTNNETNTETKTPEAKTQETKKQDVLHANPKSIAPLVHAPDSSDKRLANINK